MSDTKDQKRLNLLRAAECRACEMVAENSALSDEEFKVVWSKKPFEEAVELLAQQLIRDTADYNRMEDEG